ncbi:hypothetical protein [Hymenobacter cellulosivorans]|uniref:DUF4293 family protein n=1 Tax=Hymenobacter cellulosivorans TaxID=2932249 RepID=A0ABY4F529_9BACT|nr:hypothetical protein [Hymenobacter cellulosivorans]UOQ51772.1 hypothetical protein MUN80_18660 [Hymenobacter cellulosivorans]
MSRSRTLLLLATGAAAASVACIAACHWLLPKPPWLYDQVGGWTIYPPLGGPPQAIPARVGPTLLEYYSYLGLLAGASGAAGAALLFWLPGLIGAARNTQESPQSIGLKMLPVLLLVPCAIHLLGMIALVRRDEARQEEGVYSSPADYEQTIRYDTSGYAVPVDSLSDPGD